jgi:hypothetical protein
MNSVILTVCVYILWGGQCEITRQFVYPTMEACKYDMKVTNSKLRDGYATCTEVKKFGDKNGK